LANKWSEKPNDFIIGYSLNQISDFYVNSCDGGSKAPIVVKYIAHPCTGGWIYSKKINLAFCSTVIELSKNDFKIQDLNVDA